MRIHLSVPVTRTYPSGFPMYGSFQAACGRQLRDIQSTDRPKEVTCAACKRKRARRHNFKAAAARNAKAFASTKSKDGMYPI
jgi:hypothetical protein